MKHQPKTRRGDPSLTRRTTTTMLGLGLVAALLLSGCGESKTVNEAHVKLAPESARVDRAEPSFSNPTSITNPLFPISKLNQVIQLGEEAGDRLRFEVTLLPQTKTITWKGKQIENRVSQFVAYKNGRVLEVAVDYYAQADDGSVWYFGENVDNYEKGVIADHDGTWLAGKDGPPGMIMPAKPKVGDVYRPENIPGFVFEEVTVKSVTDAVGGPRGPVEGAILIEEKLMDGTIEDKTFAPGYGEFRARVASEDELYTAAVAVPVDARSEAVPDELSSLSTGADDIVNMARFQDWNKISATVGALVSTWGSYRKDDVPALLDQQMSDALNALKTAVGVRKAANVSQAALDVDRAGLEIQLQYRSVANVDLARFELWTRQLIVDKGAGDKAAVTGDVAILETIWNRVAHEVDDSTGRRKTIEAHLDQLRTAVNTKDLNAAADAASKIQQVIGRT